MGQQPVGLWYDKSSNLTFKWERGDPTMDVIRGNELANSAAGVIQTVPVPTTGWTDLAEVKTRAKAWLASRNGHS